MAKIFYGLSNNVGKRKLQPAPLPGSHFYLMIIMKTVDINLIGNHVDV
jgi:hypothetical protein